jgi:hypothetical protein
VVGVRQQDNRAIEFSQVTKRRGTFETGWYLKKTLIDEAYDDAIQRVEGKPMEESQINSTYSIVR